MAGFGDADLQDSRRVQCKRTTEWNRVVEIEGPRGLLRGALRGRKAAEPQRVNPPARRSPLSPLSARPPSEEGEESQSNHQKQRPVSFAGWEERDAQAIPDSSSDNRLHHSPTHPLRRSRDLVTGVPSTLPTTPFLLPIQPSPSSTRPSLPSNCHSDVQEVLLFTRYGVDDLDPESEQASSTRPCLSLTFSPLCVEFFAR